MTSMAYTRIDVGKARDLMETRQAQVVDVRDRQSYEAGHIPGALSVDESNVGQFLAAADPARPLIVCCYHGNMSQGAADYFNRNGIEETYSLDGGYEAWRNQAADVPPAEQPEASPGLDALPDAARVWIYGAAESLTSEQVGALDAHMGAFLDEWRSHGREVTPGWSLIHEQFLVIGVDERAMNLSGCSIDSMFHAVEAFGGASGLDFSRSGNHVFYRDGQGIRRLDRGDFADIARSGGVDAETIVFDNTIPTMAGLRAGRWEVPMRESWHMKAFGRSMPSNS